MRFLSYLGRAEAVPCPPNNFFNNNHPSNNNNNNINNNDAAVSNNSLLNNNNKASPPPRPPKPSRQALNLFQWRQQQEQEIERIRTFGHDSLLPPARPPKGEVEEGGACLLLLPPASPSPRRCPSKPPAPDPPDHESWHPPDHQESWPLSPRELLKLVTPSLTSHSIETSSLHQPSLPPRSSRGFLPPSSLSSSLSSPPPSSSSSSSSSPPCDLPSHSAPQQGVSTAEWANNSTPPPAPAGPVTVLTTVLTKKTELAGKIRK